MYFVMSLTLYVYNNIVILSIFEFSFFSIPAKADPVLKLKADLGLVLVLRTTRTVITIIYYK
jgi:hypothetical protein